jgi:hypothetical protein
MYKSTKVLTEICSFCGYASACCVFIVAISVLESNPSSSKAIKKERGFRSVERNITAYTV